MLDYIIAIGLLTLFFGSILAVILGGG